MPDGTAVNSQKGGKLPPMCYTYDGSFEGLLCCVYESYVAHQEITDIVPLWEAQATLYATRNIETNAANAARVYASLAKKLGIQGRYLVTTAFLYGGEEKAADIYRFIAMGYKLGTAAAYMLGDERVSRVRKMSRAVLNEAHQFTGFVRFSQYSGAALPPSLAAEQHSLMEAEDRKIGCYLPTGALAAVIEPKHHILSLISSHFCSRYPEEQFIIFDRTHKQALVYRPRQVSLMTMEEFALPPAEDEEVLCRRLWKGYYDAVAIEARENPKCRMTHLPKRFWANLTEMGV
ncbi:MAG: TIGR03915 family putative DNA repair protein [Angelakisella sp.]